MSDRIGNASRDPGDGIHATTSTQPGLRAAGGDIRQAAETARAAAGSLGQTVAEEASAVVGAVKEEGAQLLGTVQERAGELAEQGRHAGAAQAEGIARAIHRAAAELEGQSPQLAAYVHDAAGAIDGLARGLRDSGPADMLHQAERFARAQPVAFFGAAALAGFAIARFARASAPSQRGGMGMGGEMHGAYQGGAYQPEMGRHETHGDAMGQGGMGAGSAGLGGGMAANPALPGMGRSSGPGGAERSIGDDGFSAGAGGAPRQGDAASGHAQGVQAAGAPGWTEDAQGTQRPATMAAASLGGAVSYRPGAARGQGGDNRPDQGES